MVTCEDCVNFDGTICDYNGLLCDKDDYPRCDMKGFIASGADPRDKLKKKRRENDAGK